MEKVEELSYQPETISVSASSDSVVLSTDTDMSEDLAVPDVGVNHLGYGTVDGVVTADVAALYRAVEDLDVNSVEAIVRTGVDVNCIDTKYR